MQTKDMVLLIDGECTFCNKLVVWALTNRQQDNIRFFPLQSVLSIEFLANYGIKPEEILNTSYLITANTLLVKSNAIYTLSANLKKPWSFIRYFKFIPRFVADFIYDRVARSRFTLFGREKSLCEFSSHRFSRSLLTDQQAMNFFKRIKGQSVAISE